MPRLFFPTHHVQDIGGGDRITVLNSSKDPNTYKNCTITSSLWSQFRLTNHPIVCVF